MSKRKPNAIRFLDNKDYSKGTNYIPDTPTCEDRVTKKEYDTQQEFDTVRKAFAGVREKKISYVVVDDIYEEVSEDVKKAFNRYFERIVIGTAKNVIKETSDLIDDMKDQYKDKEDIIKILTELREKINS